MKQCATNQRDTQPVDAPDPTILAATFVCALAAAFALAAIAQLHPPGFALLIPAAIAPFGVFVWTLRGSRRRTVP